MSTLLALATAFVAGAVGGAVVGALGWLLARRSRSLRLAVLVPPIAAIAAVLVSVVVSTRAMFLTGEQTWLVVAACAGGAGVGLVTAVLLAVRVRRLEEDVLLERSARTAEERSDQVRRQLVAALTHDLRTPLSGIRAMAEAMEDGVAEEADEYPRRIQAEVDRTSAMVEDLFELARLQAGQVRLRRTRVDLAAAAAEVVDRLSATARARGVALHAPPPGAGPDGGPWADADADALQRALANLVVNAVEATAAAGGTDVRVTVLPEDDDARAGVAVEDGCGGIPEQDVARVFEAGWRGERARSPGRAGAGLGLAIVRELVEAHGGRVRVDGTVTGTATGTPTHAGAGPVTSTVTRATAGCRFELRLPVCGGGAPGTRRR